MATVEMTVQEALNKKKLLEKRLDDLNPSRLVFFGIRPKAENEINGMSIEEFDNMAKGNLKSVTSLISNLEAIKVAINSSNATTLIIIAGKQYTCADAIAKLHQLASIKKIWNSILLEYDRTEGKLIDHNEMVKNPENISTYLEKVIGASTKSNATLVDQLTDDYMNKNLFVMQDPNNIKAFVEAKIAELEDFEAEVHTALTTSNISTTISVEYED